MFPISSLLSRSISDEVDGMDTTQLDTRREVYLDEYVFFSTFLFLNGLPSKRIARPASGFSGRSVISFLYRKNSVDT